MAGQDGTITHWLLYAEANGRRISYEVTARDGVVHIELDGKATIFQGSVEDAVLQMPRLRSLTPGFEWTLNTDVDQWKAARLLGRPLEAVDGIQINGCWWELQEDDQGPLLVPDDWPDGCEFLTLILLRASEDYDVQFNFERAGPVCRLLCSAAWETGDEPIVVYELDDGAAVNRLAPYLRPGVMGLVGRVCGPLVDSLDYSGRRQLVQTLMAGAGSNSWLPAWWLGDAVWHGSQPLSARATTTWELEGALLCVEDETFLVRKTPNSSPADLDGTRLVLLPQQDRKLEMLFSAALALGYTLREGFAVQFEHPVTGSLAGVEVPDEDDQRRLVLAFGALGLVITGSELVQLDDKDTRVWTLERSKRSLPGQRIELPVWGWV